MRKAIAAVLGLPVIGALYFGPASRRSATLRLAAILAAGALLTVVAAGSFTVPATAYKTTPIDPVAVARMTSQVVTGYGVHQPVMIDFSEPMDAATTAAAVHIEPAASISLSWSRDARSLTVAPQEAWQPETLYTVTVDASAAAATGSALKAPASAIFVTRTRPTVQLALAGGTGSVGSPYTELDLVFSSPVERDSVAAALTVTPAVGGTVTSTHDETDAVSDHFRWVPERPLEVGASYTFALATTVHDTDGISLAAPASLDMRALGRPTIDRWKPASRATGVPIDQTVSVRFSRPMDRATTQAAFHVSGLDPLKAGRFSWAEHDTVLVWQHTAAFHNGTTYAIAIDGTARSKDGIAMGTTATDGTSSIRFTTAAKAVAQPKPKPKPKPKPVPRPSGGSSTSAPWHAVEVYFLNLLNCTHTGGWISSSGTCSGRGSNGLAPIRLSSGISNKVSRPWAKYLAQTSQLYHGCPTCRFQGAGYTTNTWWGENLSWWSGDGYQGAIQSIIFFQNEKSSNGGHYTNMMNSHDRTAGVGVWHANGRYVYAIDFYGLSVP
ncbi:MAG: Ig-like domain-containing protein [Candidatus Limnocylindrales bacterium]